MSDKGDLFTTYDLVMARLGINKSSLFNILDDFTVYCFYIEQVIGPVDIKVGENIKSVLRDTDTKNSFRLYYNHSELLFTDYGDNNKTGDVVSFVGDLFSLTEQKALEKIAYDFGLSDTGVSTCIPVRKQVIKERKKLDVKIKPFTNQDLVFWSKFHISHSTLKRYKVFSVDYLLWDNTPIKPKTLAFAYRIGQYYKIYSPYDVNYKFVNSYPSSYVEGMLQLEYRQELLIITKSLKDVMTLHEMNYEAVSPKSESTLINRAILTKLEAKYKKIVVFFDSDLRHNAHLYPYPLIMLPVPGEKDISDYVKKYGLYKGKQILKQLLSQILW